MSALAIDGYMALPAYNSKSLFFTVALSGHNIRSDLSLIFMFFPTAFSQVRRCQEIFYPANLPYTVSCSTSPFYYNGTTSFNGRVLYAPRVKSGISTASPVRMDSSESGVTDPQAAASYTSIGISAPDCTACINSRHMK